MNWGSTSTYRGQVQWIDLDRDGDLDIFATDNGASIEVYINDGTGHFTDGRAALGLTGIAVDHALDIDRDGDVDLLYSASFGRSAWYPNLLTNTVTNDPLGGGTYDVELYAPSGHIVSYLLGFARRDFLVPGIGWSALDPTLSVAWPGAAVVPASRRVTTALSVPNLQSLQGLQLFTQGVDVDPNAGTVHAMNVWPATIR